MTVRGFSRFADVLGQYIEKSGYSYSQLAKRSGLPKMTVVNWANGSVRKPREWRDVAKLAKALHLDEPEATVLLQSASYPSITELLASVDNENDRGLLLPWVKATFNDSIQITTVVRHQLPSPPRDFTGRSSDLAELMNAITKGGVTVVGLFGIGGIGKTTLALKLAEQLTAHYPDAQYYLDLKGVSSRPMSDMEAMAYIVRSNNREARLPDNAAELSGLYRSVLYGQRALLLVDNAANAEQVAALVSPPTCLMLITSRQHFTLPGLLPYYPNTLPPTDARTLLLTITNRVGDKADTIAKLCGYMPIALRLAARALAERIDLNPADYMQRLLEAKTWLQLADTTLSLSYKLLNTEMQRWWSLLAVFPGTFDSSAAGAVWRLKHEVAQEALGELVRFSLVEYDPRSARYRLHDLARLYADTQLGQADRSAGRLRHAVHYLGELKEASELYRQGGEALSRGLHLFDLEWENFQAGHMWATEHAEDEEAASELCDDYARAGWFLIELRQQPREQIRWLEAAVSTSRRRKDRAGEVYYLRRLAGAHLRLGETYHAIELFEQTLAISRELNDRHSISDALSQLGIAVRALGRHKEARQYFEESLDIAKEIDNKPMMALALRNLGVVYMWLGTPDKAKELFEASLAIAREIGDLSKMSRVLDNLGTLANNQGKYSEAKELYEESLAIARERDDRFSIAWILGNLCENACDVENHQEAMQHLHEAMPMAMNTGAIPSILTLFFSAARLLPLKGKTDHAVEILAYVLQHPASWGETKAQAEALLAELKSTLSADVVAMALARAQRKEFQEMATEIMREM